MQIRDRVRSKNIETPRDRQIRIFERYSKMREELVDLRRIEYVRVAREEIERLIRHTSTGLPLFGRSVHVADMKAGYHVIGLKLGGRDWWMTRAEVTARQAVNSRLSLEVLRTETQRSAVEFHHHSLVNSFRRRSGANRAETEAELRAVISGEHSNAIENELQAIILEQSRDAEHVSV